MKDKYLNPNYKPYNPWIYLFYFIVFGTIGYFFESLITLGTGNPFTTRGYLFILDLGTKKIVFGLPFIEIYGFGVVLIILFFRRFKKNLFLLFFLGSIVLSFFELLGSYWCQYVLKTVYWDYTNEFLNFQGRICLFSALIWGVATVLIICLVEPCFHKLYEILQKKKYFKKVLLFLLVVIISLGLIKYVIDPSIIEPQILSK